MPIDKLAIDHLTTESIRDFFQHLQESRKCSLATCNLRLAAIHVLAQFIAWQNPEYIAWAGQVRGIPFKKTIETIVPYLEKAEVDAVLAAPNRDTKQGQRDHALLLFLYNTGARASEVADLIIGDLDLKHSRSVRIVGKGLKVRHCPLWDLTISILQPLVGTRATSEKMFLNRCKRSITRFGIHTLVERYVEQAISQKPSLSRKRVSPHTFRHTTAVHLLRAGVDINTIRAWLGHVSIETTNIYAEVDLEMKSKALALCEVSGSSPSQKASIGKASIIDFLKEI